MDKSSCIAGSTVHFVCDGRGRGGHYAVTAVVAEVRRKNALVIEAKGSYSPGTRWLWPIADLKTAEQYGAECAATRAVIRETHPELFS
jgi:hypothetical protein